MIAAGSGEGMKSAISARRAAVAALLVVGILAGCAKEPTAPARLVEAVDQSIKPGMTKEQVARFLRARRIPFNFHDRVQMQQMRISREKLETVGADWAGEFDVLVQGVEVNWFTSLYCRFIIDVNVDGRVTAVSKECPR